MSTAAPVPWIQFDEDVVGENEPNGLDDVSNRPAKFIITQSDFDKDADFPGFMARFTGSSTPEGFVTAAPGHAFVDTTNQALYIKMSVASLNTGWLRIGGNASGNGSPEGVVTAQVGALYEQRDAAATVSPFWVKRSGVGNTGWRQTTGAYQGTGTGSIEIGTFATGGAVPADSIAIGRIANVLNAAAVGGIAIGQGATAAGTGINQIAIGVGASSTGQGGISIGTSAVSGTDIIAIGNAMTGSAANDSIIIGRSAACNQTNCVIIGLNTVANSGTNAVAVGQGAQANNARCIAIGVSATVGVASAISIGDAAIVSNGTGDNVVIGHSASTLAGATGQCVAIGASASVSSPSCIAIGGTAVVNSGLTNGCIVIGPSSTANAQGQIIIGRSIVATTTATGGVYIGDSFTMTAAAGAGQVVIGRSLTTGANANNILIGNGFSMAGGSGIALAGSITVGGSAFSVAIGASVTSGSGGCVNIAGTISGSNAVAIGTGSSAAATAVGIGSSSSTGGQATAAGAVAVGAFCTATAGESLAIGFGAGSSHASAICLGRAQSIQTLEFVVGGGNGQISQFRFNQDTKAAPTAMTFRQENASGSNIAGANWTFIASRNTGSGASGQIIFQVGAVNGTAATLGVATTTFIIDRTVAVGAAVNTVVGFLVGLGVTANASAYASRITSTLTAAANNDLLVGMSIAPTYTPGAFTGVVQVGLDIGSVSGGATNLAIRSASSRSLLGTTTVNGGNTGGMTINQGTNDDEIISFKSSDVAHGITGVAETDTFGFIRKTSATAGGSQLVSISSDSVGFFSYSLYTNGITTKSNASDAATVIRSSKKSGTGVTAMGANENLIAFQADTTTRFILDADGDSHQDVGTAWTNFDTHDDVALLNKLSAHVTRIDDPLRSSFGRWLEESRDDLQRLKLVTFNLDGHHFVNMSRLTMLHTGAIRQLGDRFARIEQALMKANLLPAEV